jgi:hypothetical protein
MRRPLLAAVLAALLFAPAGEAWTWPAAGAVLQPFLFDPAHPYAAGQHRGIAIGGDAGATVLAPASGSVAFAGTVPSSGKSVTIATADGYAVTLTQLGSITVARGATVAEGDGVGAIGATGDAEIAQPYVHLGVRIAAEAQGYLDPLTFLPVRGPAPAAIAPPVPVADPPAAAPPLAGPAPAPAPVSDPVPAVRPAPAPVATPAAALAPAAPAAEAPPVESLPVESPVAPLSVKPQAATAPGPAPVAATPAMTITAGEPAAPRASASPRPVREDTPVHGGTHVPVLETSIAGIAAPTEATPRGGAWAAGSSVERRAARAPDRAAADARGRTGTARSLHPFARPQPTKAHDTMARARSAPAEPVAAIATRFVRYRGGLLLPVLAAAALLAAAVLAEALGAVRMMVRCGSDTQEDPGRSGLAVCGGSPSPRSRGGLRRSVGRVRSLSPAEGQRRPHGEWHRRARHAGDGGRRRGGQVLR